MTGLAASVGYGPLVAGRPAEKATLVCSERMRRGAQRSAVYAHGLGGVAADYLPRGNSVPWALAERGFATICPDLGGVATFGNDDSIDAVSDAVDELTTRALGKVDKFVLVGGSMGTLDTHNYAVANPSKVSALVLFLFAADMRDIHADDALGAADDIENAYPSGWAASMATHNPVQMTAAAAAASVPTFIFNALSDNTCEWAYAVQYRDAVDALNPGQVTLIDIDLPASWNPTGQANGHSSNYFDCYAAVEEMWRLGALS